MNKALIGVSITGIIEPGQLYILGENRDRGWNPQPIDCLFCIREDKEILEALDMDYSIILAEKCELKKYLGFKKINRNCYEFKLLVYEKDEGEEVRHSVYLHRILTFSEFLANTRKLFRQS